MFMFNMAPLHGKTGKHRKGAPDVSQARRNDPLHDALHEVPHGGGDEGVFDGDVSFEGAALSPDVARSSAKGASEAQRSHRGSHRGNHRGTNARLVLAVTLLRSAPRLSTGAGSRSEGGRPASLRMFQGALSRPWKGVPSRWLPFVFLATSVGVHAFVFLGGLSWFPGLDRWLIRPDRALASVRLGEEGGVDAPELVWMGTDAGASGSTDETIPDARAVDDRAVKERVQAEQQKSPADKKPKAIAAAKTAEGPEVDEREAVQEPSSEPPAAPAAMPRQESPEARAETRTGLAEDGASTAQEREAGAARGEGAQARRGAEGGTQPSASGKPSTAGSAHGSLQGWMRNIERFVHARARRAYPMQARRDKQEGVATIEVAVHASGAIKSVRLAKSTGHPLLDRAALASVRDIGRFPAAPGASSWKTARRFLLPIKFHLR